MKNCLKLFLSVCLLFLTFSAKPHITLASSNLVKVTLPTFDVTINGQKIKNDYRKYPFIVYKDITYFPMTWYDSRVLGIETTWSAQAGLHIKKSKITSSYEPYSPNKKNAKTYNATIRQGTLNLNGKVIQNNQEQYPFLTLNDITYFPLTWKFAHDEFGWAYKWDSKNGLSITSDNPKIQTLNFPSSSKDSAVAVFNNYYYFTDLNNTNRYVYRAPINNPTIKELVYSYPLNNEESTNNVNRFFVQDGQLWFTYHVGGATMGSDVYIRINENGKGTEIYNGYFNFIHLKDGAVIKYHRTPEPNNISFIPNGKHLSDGVRFGGENTVYGYIVKKSGQWYNYTVSNTETVVNNDLYILSTKNPDNNAERNQIAKINLITYEETPIIKEPVADFSIYNNQLYYVKENDHKLYYSNVDGTNEILLSTQPVSWFDVTNEGIFYVSNETALYSINQNGSETKITEDQINSVQINQDKLYVKVSNPKYGMKIFDTKGKHIVTITDQVHYFFIHNGKLIFTGQRGVHTLH